MEKKCGLCIRSFRLDAEVHVLSRDGNLVPLAPKAVEILVALLERQSQVVSKEDLLQQAWPDTFVDEHNLVHYVPPPQGAHRWQRR